MSVEKTALTNLQERGIDPQLFNDDPEIVFRYCAVPADYRWQRSHGNNGLGVEDFRSANLAPAISTGVG